MMKRVLGIFSTSSIAVLVLLCTVERVTAQSPAKAKSNQELIEKEAEGILKLAHPTVTLNSATYDKITEFQDGSYALRFLFKWTNAFGDATCYRYWDFKFTKDGTIYDIVDGKTNTTFKPFDLTDAVIDGIKDVIRDQIKKGELKQDDPGVKPILEAPNGRKLTIQLLHLTQILGQN
jgi:hypothetical protein